MRPILRGSSPELKKIEHYDDARTALKNRIGSYCSYCECPLDNGEIEHIQPQSKYPNLKHEWTNYLLACSDCNKRKGAKGFDLKEALLPDRDNTFYSFEYSSQGDIQVKEQISATQEAETLMKILSFDKYNLGLEKRRREIWEIAVGERDDIKSSPDRRRLRIPRIINFAKTAGCFSIWMTVFRNDEEMLQKLIDAFPGTRASACFNEKGEPITPCPNLDKLGYGGKI